MSSIGAGYTNSLNKLIREAGSVIGYKLETFEVVLERRPLNKLLSITDNPDHPQFLCKYSPFTTGCHLEREHKAVRGIRKVKIRCRKKIKIK